LDGLRHLGDLLDDVVQRGEVQNVDGGDDIDPGCEELFDVLSALALRAPPGTFVCASSAPGSRSVNAPPG
jgi:hypothetical protein